ncbi:unnamed protein product [Closterium sp. NIES-53]
MGLWRNNDTGPPCTSWSSHCAPQIPKKSHTTFRLGGVMAEIQYDGSVDMMQYGCYGMGVMPWYDGWHGGPLLLPEGTGGDVAATAASAAAAAALPLLGLLQLFLWVVVSPAVAEELLFRGLLLTALQERLGRIDAAMLSAAIFALFHLSLSLLFPNMALGISAGLLAILSNSVMPAVALHATYNASALLYALVATASASVSHWNTYIEAALTVGSNVETRGVGEEEGERGEREMEEIVGIVGEKQGRSKAGGGKRRGRSAGETKKRIEGSGGESAGGKGCEEEEAVIVIAQVLMAKFGPQIVREELEEDGGGNGKNAGDEDVEGEEEAAAEEEKDGLDIEVKKEEAEAEAGEKGSPGTTFRRERATTLSSLLSLYRFFSSHLGISSPSTVASLLATHPSLLRSDPTSDFLPRVRLLQSFGIAHADIVHISVLQRFNFTYSSPQATPLSTRHSLSALPSDESVEPSGPILARYVAPGRHRPEHMAAAKRVLPYLCSTSGMGLVLGGRRPVVLTGHADASWADDQATQRSSQGYTFSLGSGSELRWLTYLLTDLGEQPRSPPVLYVDNKAMLALCREHRLEHRTKHIALRYFLARELQQRGQLRLGYVASEANTADIFTKALAPGDHQRFCTLLGLVPTWPHLLTS